MLKGTELLHDIELDIDILEPQDGEGLDPRLTDLKIKYLMLDLLNEIHTQLYEISHCGIGTD
jgi:hypothetical protein